MHFNFSNVDNIFAYVFGNASNELQNIDVVNAKGEETTACVQPCVGVCYQRCGVWFVESIDPLLNNGTSQRDYYNETFTHSIDNVSMCAARIGTAHAFPGLSRPHPRVPPSRTTTATTTSLTFALHRPPTTGSA